MIIFDEWIFNLGCASSPLGYLRCACFDYVSLLFSRCSRSPSNHDGSLELIYYITHSLVCWSKHSISLLSLPSFFSSVYLSLSIFVFFSSSLTIRFPPSSLGLDPRALSVGQVRRRRLSSPNLPFRKQSNLIHRMWTRMFASMCFFFFSSADVKEAQQSRRGSSNATHEKKIVIFFFFRLPHL